MFFLGTPFDPPRAGTILRISISELFTRFRRDTGLVQPERVGFVMHDSNISVYAFGNIVWSLPPTKRVLQESRRPYSVAAYPFQNNPLRQLRVCRHPPRDLPNSPPPYTILCMCRSLPTKAGAGYGTRDVCQEPVQAIHGERHATSMQTTVDQGGRKT